MRSRKPSLIPAIALVAACGVDPATAPAALTPLAARATVFRRPYDPNYIEEGRRVLQGVHLANEGCRVGSVDTMKAGERILEWVAEYDIATCVLTLARGRYVGPERESLKYPSRIQVDSARIGGQARGVEVAYPSNRIASPGAQRAPLFDINWNCDPMLESAWQGYQRLITEDPVQWDVNWDRIEYEWMSRPSQNCIQSAVMTHSAWSQPITGWSISAFWTVENAFSTDGSYVQGSVSSQHINYAFCLPTVPTYVYYRVNKMRVFPDGHVVFEWWWEWSGDCSSLLHADRETAVWGN